jgi:hypothetical protein
VAQGVTRRFKEELIMDIIGAKAQAVVDNAGISGGGVATWLPIVIGIITQLFGGGGLGLCTPTSTTVHQFVTGNGLNRLQRRRRDRVIGRVVNENVSDGATAATIEDSFDNVAQGLSVADTSAMYQQANGAAPRSG